MSEIAARFTRLAADFAATAEAVPPERWDSPSPCPEWTARGVVGHLVENQVMFLGFVHRGLGDIPSAADDPVGSWRAAAAVVQAELADPERAAATFDGFFGRSRFDVALDRFVNFDLIVHRWDLAQAAGLELRLDPADIDWAAEKAASFGDMLHSDGVCGPALVPPPGSGRQTAFLASVGRRAW
ncbi:uncharacterized protein (TIGR03086 family) [Murinocardiopsis flavida]|uniref:Uncharacterized protein (TIGR03086 family) n=1 Tax=Murinocardiopsis flavida TaxID=645275 RepID=A0A2P8DE28_9ACTN|nr:TIGR03086 family metal-binding protein [Murinocardiopsis flavida]PSK95481.1 uncharacterized protein (TIGR03086 family) [Murinocardiopsis flavida]